MDLNENQRRIREFMQQYRPAAPRSRHASVNDSGASTSNAADMGGASAAAAVNNEDNYFLSELSGLGLNPLHTRGNHTLGELLNHHVNNNNPEAPEWTISPVKLLHELMQKLKITPKYASTLFNGDIYAKFKFVVYVGKVSGHGESRSKKTAKNLAAKDALCKLAKLNLYNTTLDSFDLLGKTVSKAKVWEDFDMNFHEKIPSYYQGSPVRLLQQVLNRNNEQPRYSYINTNLYVKLHTPTCYSRVKAGQVMGYGAAEKRGEAKELAAKDALKKLADAGVRVPRRMRVDGAQVTELLRTNAVAVVLKFAIKHELPLASYEVISAMGPQHLLLFTFECKLGELTTVGTEYTKKKAKQISANLMYYTLIELLARARDDDHLLQLVNDESNTPRN